MTEYRPLRIALLGAGSVGAQVARLLTENKRINGEDFEAVTRALPLRAEEPVSSLDINKPD